MNDQAAIDELIDRLRAESDPTEPSLEKANHVVEAAWPTLDAHAKSKLVVSGSRRMRSDDDLLDASVSDELATRIRRASGSIRYVSSPSADGAGHSSEAIDYVDYVDPGRSERIDVPSVDVIAMAGAGLIDRERARTNAEESAAERDRIKSLRDDLQAGHIGPDALGEDDYQQVIRPDSAGDAQVTCGASILGILVALAAGIVVALITWDAALFLLVAIGGSIAGTTATLALPAIYHAIDTEWLRRGSHAPGTIITFAAGPASSLIVALVVLWYASNTG